MAAEVPNPAQLLERWEAWRVQLARLGALEDRGQLPGDAHEATDTEAADLCHAMGGMLAALVGRQPTPADDVFLAGWRLAIDPRARKALEAAEANDIDLLDPDTQELYGLGSEWVWGEVDRFLLIERNVKGSTPPWWVTFHDDAEQAASYHRGQEYPEDYEVELVADLDGTDG